MTEATSRYVGSESDERVVNNDDNDLRHNYRVLSDVEKGQMKAIKDTGQMFLNVLDNVGGTEGNRRGRNKSRELSLAATKIQEAVMWAVNHVTR